MIDPRVASGLRDLAPDVTIPRERMLAAFRRTFASFGFVPIETPHIERMEVLTGKGAGSDEVLRQIFEVTNKGGTPGELALRFDLTVPLARFMARHVDELGVPFKRYAIGSVFRGERPAKGRFREFVQCDFDTIGTESVLADAEIAQVIHAALDAAGVPSFTITLNHRKILDGMLGTLGLSGRTGAVLRSLDKLAKIGRQAVAEELQKDLGSGGAGLSAEQAGSVLDFAEAGRGGVDVLREAEALLGASPQAGSGHRQPEDRAGPPGRGRHSPGPHRDRPGAGSRARLLHGHRLRDDRRGMGEVRQRGLGRALRRSGQSLHSAAAAGGRGVDRAGPAAGPPGRGRPAGVCKHDDAGPGGQLSGHRSGDPVPAGRPAADRRHRRGGLSRANPDRQADGLWVEPGPPARGDRRARRGVQESLQPSQSRHAARGQGASLDGAGRLGPRAP